MLQNFQAIRLYCTSSFIKFLSVRTIEFKINWTLLAKYIASMPTTRSGAHYGPGALPKDTSTTKQLLPSKRKAAVKKYTKAMPQPSKIKASKIKQDAGKKKASQYKKPPTKASATS